MELVHRESEDWLYGRLGTNEGIFPANYVQVVIPPPQKPATQQSPPSVSMSVTENSIALV